VRSHPSPVNENKHVELNQLAQLAEKGISFKNISMQSTICAINFESCNVPKVYFWLCNSNGKLPIGQKTTIFPSTEKFNISFNSAPCITEILAGVGNGGLNAPRSFLETLPENLVQPSKQNTFREDILSFLSFFFKNSKQLQTFFRYRVNSEVHQVSVVAPPQPLQHHLVHSHAQTRQQQQHMHLQSHLHNT